MQCIVNTKVKILSIYLQYKYGIRFAIFIRHSLVPRRSLLGQSWTLPWAVTSPRDTRRERQANTARSNMAALLSGYCNFSRKLLKIRHLNRKSFYVHATAKIYWLGVLSPALSQTSRGQRGRRERLGTRLAIRHLVFLTSIKNEIQVFNCPYPLDLIEGVLHNRWS